MTTQMTAQMTADPRTADPVGMGADRLLADVALGFRRWRPGRSAAQLPGDWRGVPACSPGTHEASSPSWRGSPLPEQPRGRRSRPSPEASTRAGASSSRR